MWLITNYVEAQISHNYNYTTDVLHKKEKDLVNLQSTIEGILSVVYTSAFQCQAAIPQ